MLLGVKAVIAESFERIHRSNLVGMGVLPLQFAAGESAASLKLTGLEVFELGSGTGLKPGGDISVRATPRMDRLCRSSSRRGWTRLKKWSLSVTAASCRMCCGSWSGTEPGLRTGSADVAVYRLQSGLS